MNNKKILTFIFFLSVGVVAFAQKGSVTKADTYLSKGEFVSAKAEIDVAVTIEKAASKSKTWFSRGKIYQAIATSEDEGTKAIDPDALQKSVEAYSKVIGMEKPNSSYSLISTTNLDQIWGNFLNAGGTAYGEANYELALDQFQKALIVKESDSTTLYYAAVSAQQANNVDKALEYYYKMIDADIAAADVYSSVIYFERKNENPEKALEITRTGKEKFPEDSRFGQEEISLLLSMDKVDEAKVELEKAIEEDPENINLHLNLGVLYDNLGSAMASEDKDEEAKMYFDKAKTSYINALEIDPDNYIANFNAGVIYVNLAKEYYDKVRDMDYKQYQKYGEAETQKADVILKEGLPYMEKATSIEPEDVSGLTALQQMYTQLKMNDKAMAVLDKIDVLNAAE